MTLSESPVVRSGDGRRDNGPMVEEAPMRGYDVTRAGRDAAELLRQGESLSTVWRLSVLQLLDVYESRLRREGTAVAARVFEAAPEPAGDARVDAALAALAEHLARRDDWPVPDWSREPSRVTDDWWFVTELPGMHPWSLRESPLSFRQRGVFIAANGLERV
jgi:hypothetical protein